MSRYFAYNKLIFADGLISTGMSNTPTISPDGGKVHSGVVGMDKLLALKSVSPDTYFLGFVGVIFFQFFCR